MKNKFVKIIMLFAVVSSLIFATACGSNSSGKKYKVTFDTLGGSAVSGYTLSAGAKINRPSKTPTKEMFVFDDWYADRALSQKFEFGSKMPAHNITVYAGWRGETSVIVSYDANGGEYSDLSQSKDFVGNVGSAIEKPAVDPTKIGYTFSGWYEDANCTTVFNGSVYPAENTTLYAGWDKNSGYAYVSFYGNGNLIKVVPVVKGQAMTAPTDIFDEFTESTGWYKDSNMTEAYSFGATVSSDQNLYTTYYTRGLQITNGVVTGYSGEGKNIVVPSIFGGKTVTAIGAEAFLTSSSVKSITSVALPKTVTAIGDAAFYGCTYLVNINLTSAVKTIGDNAFYNNQRLKSVGDLSQVTSIGKGAFLGCKDMREIALSETLTSLGEYAFTNCESLIEITVPSKIEIVADYMFSGCKSLKKAVIAAPSVKNIGYKVFDGCPSLTVVRILSKDVPGTWGDGDQESPFAGAPNVKILVPKLTLNSYKFEYGYMDGGSLLNKFGEI